MKKKKNSRKLIKLIGNELSFHFWLILHYGLSYSDKQSQHCFTIKKFNVRHEGDDDERQEMTSDSEVDEFAMVWKKFKHSDIFFFWKLWWIENIKLVTLWLYKINSAFFCKCHLQYKIDAKLQRCLQVIFLGNQEPILKDNLVGNSVLVLNEFPAGSQTTNVKTYIFSNKETMQIAKLFKYRHLN